MAAPILVASVVLVLSIWKLICVALRNRRAKFLASLDPVKDAHKLLWFAYTVEFPWLSQKGLEFVLFRPFESPSISKLIFQTKNFTKQPSKRADDTDLLMKEMIFHHVDSDRGSYALRRINAMHSQFDIPNEDFIYVLCMFALHPIEFASRFGYREWTEAEKLASYTVWHDLGVRLGFKDIPKSLSEMQDFLEEYETIHTAYDEKSPIIIQSLKNMVLQGLPRIMRPLGNTALDVLFMNDRLRKATGYSRQPVIMEYIVLGLVKFFAGTLVGLLMPPRPVSMAWDRFDVDWSPNPAANPDQLRELKINLYTPSVYKDGYRLSELGALKRGQIGKVHEGPLLCPFSSRSVCPE